MENARDGQKNERQSLHHEPRAEIKIIVIGDKHVIRIFFQALRAKTFVSVDCHGNSGEDGRERTRPNACSRHNRTVVTDTDERCPSNHSAEENDKDDRRKNGIAAVSTLRLWI